MSELVKKYSSYKDRNYKLSAIDEIKYLENVIEEIYIEAIQIEYQKQKLENAIEEITQIIARL